MKLRPAESFNSCPHAEGNPNTEANHEPTAEVSIRALTRRATSCGNWSGRRYDGFNSCPHAEGNPTTSSISAPASSFNSCPHAEGNLAKKGFIRITKVSIRALTRRATSSGESSSAVGSSFNSCPHAEGNSRLLLILSPRLQFQFVPSRGGQPAVPKSIHIMSEFQFVPSRGGQPAGESAFGE